MKNRFFFKDFNSSLFLFVFLSLRTTLLVAPALQLFRLVAMRWSRCPVWCQDHNVKLYHLCACTSVQWLYITWTVHRLLYSIYPVLFMFVCGVCGGVECAGLLPAYITPTSPLWLSTFALPRTRTRSLSFLHNTISSLFISFVNFQ